MRLFAKCLVFFLIATTLSHAADVNWPRWRGPDTNGSMTKGQYPVQWDPETVLWKTEVPGKGCSTPIVWNKTIYLTTGIEGLDTVIALDWSGQQILAKTSGLRGGRQTSKRIGQQPLCHNRWVRCFCLF